MDSWAGDQGQHLVKRKSGKTDNPPVGLDSFMRITEMEDNAGSSRQASILFGDQRATGSLIADEESEEFHQGHQQQQQASLPSGEADSSHSNPESLMTGVWDQGSGISGQNVAAADTLLNAVPEDGEDSKPPASTAEPASASALSTASASAIDDAPLTPSPRIPKAPVRKVISSPTISPSFRRSPQRETKSISALGGSVSRRGLMAHSPSQKSPNPRRSIFGRKSAKQPGNARATLLANRLANRRSSGMKTRRGSKDIEMEDIMAAGPPIYLSPSAQRHYKSGDYVLVRSHMTQFCTLVNRYGFPPGEGDRPEEQRGPYIFVLATVKTIHFDESAPYYTVTRCDIGTDQRADIAFMEPLNNPKGEVAAMRAASSGGRSGQQDDSYAGRDLQDGASGDQSNKLLDFLHFCCFILVLPFFWLYDWLIYLSKAFIIPSYQATLAVLRYYATLILNGREPFVCGLRLTFVNLMVVCSIWYNFIDQFRLAFLPPSADDAIAAVNFAVWITLVAELLFEVFVRPEGYKKLIISDKAYAPNTVRLINAFHLVVESLSLGLFIPEFFCIWRTESCSYRYPFSLHNAVLLSVTGPTRLKSFYGHAFQALLRLRVFGLVRHWRNMWITSAFINMTWSMKQNGYLSAFVPSFGSRKTIDRKSLLGKTNMDPEAREEKMKELNLTNTSNIGTALMVTNSYRALVIMWVIMGLFPVMLSFKTTAINSVTQEMTKQLQRTNLLVSDTSKESCTFLQNSIATWVGTMTSAHYETNDRIEDPFLLSLVIKPYRCGLSENRYINAQLCEQYEEDLIATEEQDLLEICESWSILHSSNATEDEPPNNHNVREGSTLSYRFSDMGYFTTNETDGSINTKEIEFSVFAVYDQTAAVETASRSSFLLQLFMLLFVLGGLSILRRDAEILVLGPLRRMLKIVARYAKNPLAPPKINRRTNFRRTVSLSRSSTFDEESSSERSLLDGGDDSDAALGSYETETLITAVTKITDLLRKCWGVAGADIISTNLATREGALTEVFNPTVPGKSVYALFAFAAISGFDLASRCLGGDVIDLINDTAKVVHDEVFRWGFGDSGQCNKNLGAAFLMVFRIGLVEEVIEKLEQATDVIFSTKSSQSAAALSKRRGKVQFPSRLRSSASSNASGRQTSNNSRRKSHDRDSTKAMSLSLQSLPGISTFTDRAVIGMLKSFAGIHRDEKILKWNDDFRLSAGVGVFQASLIFGMDAGWAVEGAVGSEYKIDATYLSPHVNMASRMMSACKQYGVTIMLSQAVQELMSDVACSKLRHLDTVTVKGSSVKQKIYTYDCKAKGVDFFLYGRSDSQADVDAERYSPNIWNTDQDLRAMRQHVTDDFLKQFRDGHKAYLSGAWETAIEVLERANNTMFETAIEEGYLEDEFDSLQIYAGQDFTKAADDLKRENGDGPSTYLINYMKSCGGKAPEDWDGWHPLTRK